MPWSETDMNDMLRLYQDSFMLDFSRAELALLLLRHDVFLRRVNGHIVSVVMIEVVDIPFIWNVATAPSHRRLGFASALVQEALAVYPAAGLFVDATHASCSKLVAWYETLGFACVEPTGVACDIRPADALFMRR